jgi:hypothetical protein
MARKTTRLQYTYVYSTELSSVVDMANGHLVYRFSTTVICTTPVKRIDLDHT